MAHFDINDEVSRNLDGWHLQVSIETDFFVKRKALDRAVWALVILCERKDPYTAKHQLRVAELAYAVGKEMGLSDEQLDGMCVMSIVHDIGKVVLPNEILNKPGRLTPEEFNLVKSHPKTGYEVLKSLEFPWPVAEAILQHHERLDGSGYPAGLCGDDIILEARVLGVVDVFESMVSHRPYRPACGAKEGLRELVKNSGILYDPVVVEAFCRLGGKRILYLDI